MWASHNIDSVDFGVIWFQSLAYPILERVTMLRNHYLTQVRGFITANQRFRDTDFELDVTNDDGAYVLAVRYIYEPDYKFLASIDVPDDGVVEGNLSVAINVSPGVMFKNERIVSYTSKLNDEIKNWLTRLGNELASVPAHRRLEEQQREIQNILEQLDDVSGDYFSKREAEDLRIKLEEMEARLTANLEATITDQKDLQEQVDAITSDMSLLKQNIGSLNKRGWAKSFVTRTFEWVKVPANRKVLTSGAEVAKELLLEAGKHIQSPD